MPDENDTVKLIEGALSLGFSLSDAVQRVLPTSLAQFARDNGFKPSEVYMCLGFYEGRVYDRIRRELAERLGIPREHLDKMIESQEGAEKNEVA